MIQRFTDTLIWILPSSKKKENQSHTNSKQFQSNSSQKKKNRFWQPTITNSISPKNIQRKSIPRRLIRGSFLFKLVDAGSSGLPPSLFGKRQKRRKRHPAYIDRTRYTPDERNSRSWPWSIAPPSPPLPPRCVFFLSPRIYSSSLPSTPSLENPAQVFSSRDKAWKRWAGITRPSPSGLESVDLSRCFVSWAGCMYVWVWVLEYRYFWPHYWLIARETITLVFDVCFWRPCSDFLIGR